MKSTQLNEQLDVCEHEKNVVLRELDSLRIEFEIYNAFYGTQRSLFRFRTVVYTTVFIQVNGKG